MPHTVDSAIAQQLVEDALARVLASRGFCNSARKRRFLQFVVEQTLAGRADRIKAYSIAVDVFDRDESFDPMLDPVVRIQAGRIRQCLDHYYETEGGGDPIRISIPKGSYVPRFAARPGHVQPNAAPTAPEEPAVDAPPSPPPAGRPGLFRPRPAMVATAVPAVVAVLLLVAAWSGAFAPPGRGSDGPAAAAAQGPALVVLPFANRTGNAAQDPVVDSFTEELAGALVRSGRLLVFAAGPGPRDHPSAAPSDAEPMPDIDFVLKGSVDQAGGEVQVTVTVINAKSGQYLWSDRFRGDAAPAAMVDLRKGIALRTVHVLEQTPRPAHAATLRSTAVRAALAALSP